MQIRFKDRTYGIIQDGNDLYFLMWRHPEQLDFYKLTEEDYRYESLTKIPFEENMELITNANADYYENNYRLNKGDDGSIQITLTAVGILNQSLQPAYNKYK